MGAWGVNIFENDFACDFLAFLTKSSNDPLETIIETLENGLDTEYLEVDDGDSIVVCSLIIVGLKNRKAVIKKPNNELPQYFANIILQFIDKYQTTWDEHYKNRCYTKDLDILGLATGSMKKVISYPKTSELYELWHDSSYFDEWKQTIYQLIKDLQE